MLNIPFQLIIFSLFLNAKGANIFAVFPTPSIGPQHKLTTLIQELAKRGHNITLLTSNPIYTKFDTTENIATVDLHNKFKRIWLNYNSVLVSDQNVDVLSEFTLNLQTINDIFEEMIQTVEFKNLLAGKESKFDLLLLEASMIPLLSLSHVFKAPVILVSSIGAVLNNYEIVGAPTHLFLYPSTFQHRIYNLTRWEKLTELSTYVRLQLKFQSNENKVEVMLKKHFGADFPLVKELKKNVFALFVNSHPIWAGNHPVPPNVVFIGGIPSNNKEELPQDLKSFLDKSRKGVIYVSFGSNIKPTQLPPNKLLKILNVLSEISYDILLKWDSDRLAGVPKNIKISKWLPQPSLLAHPKIKLFITQGGIQSTFEAIDAGVPLIGIPMYSDQWYNTEKYIKFHIGLQIDLGSLTEEKLIEAIQSVINDESYRTSVRELRALMYEQPVPLLERAIWWTEQVLLPYGVRHLRSPAANISWTEYLELDFVFSLFLLMFVVVIVFFSVMTLFIRYLFKSIVDVKKKMT